MRITLHTDYALRVLLHLATHPDRLWSIADMAGTHGVSRNHLMKVVNELGRAGYVRSVRGRAGGIRLSRPAGQINIGDVVRRMEGDLCLVDCPGCSIARMCGLRGALGEALKAFLAVLDGYSLADIVTKQPGRDALFGSLFGDAA